MTFFEDLKWRGLIKDISSPKLEELINKGGLTFYIGTDPTGDSLHIGHFSSFLIAERLKRMGHNPILLIGGATGQIGDPKPTAERAMITKEEVNHNVEALTNQVKKIFGFKVVNNYDWSKDINFIDYLRDYGKYFSINYMLDKDIIRRRLESGITYTEFSYMIMQSLDYLWLAQNMNCVLQVAGQDQWGNITAGIDLIRKKTGKEVYGLTMPLITKKDGTKFGKSEGNAIWLDINKTSAYEMYQFFINTEDEMIISYLKMLTFLSKEEIEEIEKIHLEKPELRIAHKKLAEEVITFLHGHDEYLKALKISESLFNENVTNLNSDDIIKSLTGVPTIQSTLNISLVDFLVNNNIVSSKREAREFISNNAISINNKKINDLDYMVDDKDTIENKVMIVRKGKKNYYLVKVKN